MQETGNTSALGTTRGDPSKPTAAKREKRREQGGGREGEMWGEYELIRRSDPGTVGVVYTHQQRHPAIIGLRQSSSLPLPHAPSIRAKSSHTIPRRTHYSNALPSCPPPSRRPSGPPPLCLALPLPSLPPSLASAQRGISRRRGRQPILARLCQPSSAERAPHRRSVPLSSPELRSANIAFRSRMNEPLPRTPKHRATVSA